MRKAHKRIICGAANGMMGFSQKLFVKCSPEASAAVFNLYTYIVSAAMLFVCCVTAGRASKEKEPADIKHIFGFIAVMAVCLFANSYFMTVAAEYLPSAQLYPLSQGMALILSSFMSAVFFKERLTPKCIFGVVLSFIALLIINM